MQAFFDTVGVILEAGEGGSVDIFEIQLAFVAATRECARPAQSAPSQASRPATPRAAPFAQQGGVGASPSSSPLGVTRSIGKHRQSADKALKTYKSLPPQRPRPRGVAPGHRVRTGARGAVSVANAAKVTAGKLKHCPPFAEPYPRECHCTPQGLGDCFLNEGSTQFVFLRDKLDLARGDGRSSGADASTGGGTFNTLVYGSAARWPTGPLAVLTITHTELCRTQSVLVFDDVRVY